MKTFAEEQAENHQSAFESAVEEKDVEYVSSPLTPKYEEVPEDDEDYDIVIGDPNAVVEEEKTPEPSAGEALNRLVDILAAGQNKPVEEEEVVRPGIASVDLEAVRKNFNDNLHESEDPFTVAMQTTQQVLGPQLAQQARVIQELKRDALRTNPDKAYVLDTYGKEVERVVAQLPAEQQNHPDIYDYAVNQIMVKHISEIATKKAEELVQSRTAKTVRPGATRSVGQTQGGAGTKTRRKVEASRTDQAMAQKYGMSLKDYLQTRGKI